jgi:molecular chaperone GrpE
MADQEKQDQENMEDKENGQEHNTDEKQEGRGQEEQTGWEQEQEQQQGGEGDGGTEGKTIEELQKEVDELKQKNEELKDKHMRLFADFDNYKKRVSKEKTDIQKNASEEVLKELLPVIDDFERALETADNAENVDSVNEGTRLIYQKMMKTLGRKGLQPMESKGHDFDPEYQEAVTEIPAPSDDQKGKVIDEIEKGYYLNDKILRFAKVVVGK